MRATRVRRARSEHHAVRTGDMSLSGINYTIARTAFAPPIHGELKCTF
jgi:hypothetical protein